MKKSIITILIIISALSASHAQGFKVQSAINYLKSGDLDAAKTAINEATQDPKTGVQAKTWFYRGLIYQSMHDNNNAQIEKVKPGMTKQQVITAIGEPRSTNKVTTASGQEDLLVYDGTAVTVDANGKVDDVKPTATEDQLMEAFNSYKKAMEINPKNEWSDDIKQAMKSFAIDAYNIGVPFYNSHDFQNAYDRFKVSFEVYKYVEITFDSTFKDTFSTLYGAFAAARIKKNDESQQLFQSLLDRKIDLPEIYSGLGEVYFAKGDTLGGQKVFAAGAKKFPGDKDLMIKDLNTDIASNNYNAAIEKLKAAIAKDPNLAALYIQLGNAYDELKDTANARAAYEQAITKDPANLIGYFQIGVSYYNRAVDINTAMNKLPDSQQKQIDALKILRDATFKKSLPYLEHAHQIDPKDMDTMIALKQLYAHLNMSEKLENIKKEIEAAKQ